MSSPFFASDCGARPSRRAALRGACLASLGALLLALFAPATAHAQNAAVTGVVTDAETGEALPGANVAVVGPDGAVEGGAATDLSGAYSIGGLEAGRYTLRTTFVGYQRDERPITLAAGQTLEADVALAVETSLLDQVVVSASRRQEKVLEAPASISVLEPAELTAETTTSSVEALRTTTGVDMAQTGLDRREVVLRGFNNAFSGATFVLTDYRQASVPSLGVNVFSIMPAQSIDLERVEVVRGPGSALYGPGVANGVVHFFTKGPFEYPGATVSVSGGQQSFFSGNVRLAGPITDNLAVKFTGAYAQGDDWALNVDNPQDQAEIDDYNVYGVDEEIPGGRRVQPVDRDGDGQTDGFRLRRDLDYQKFNVNGQAQYRFGGASTLTLAGGTAQLTSPVQSGIGTLQADGFGYTYGQLRLQSGDFFAQVFLNANDAGDSYVYGSGEQVVDEGLQWNVQSQYIFGVNPLDTEFTVGGEVNLIEPRTGETITGRNEGDDSINLYGAYAQTSSTLSEKFDLTLAARLDYNNVEEIPLVSPRAALVFKINPQNTLRATYNRVYSAPGTNSNFLDLAAQVTSFEGTPFEFVLQGRGAVDGFSFGEFRNNRQVRLFLPTGIPGADFGDPVSLAQYPVLPVYGATAQEFASRLQSGQSFSGPLANFTPEQLQAYAQLLGGIAQSTVPTTTASEEDATPGVLLGIPNSEAQLGYDVVGDPTDIEPLGQTQTQTFELGYRGVLGSKLIFTVDGYYERKNNFIGPLRVESPLVYLNPQFVAGNVQQTLATNPQLAQAFAQLSTSTQLSDEQLISLIAATFGQTASGVVQPNEPVLASNGTRVGGLVSYRNFGEIDYYGVDVNAEFRPMRQLDLFANASYVSDGFFTGEELGEDPESDLNVALNAPTFKTRGGFRARLDNGLSFTGAASYVDDFRVASGPYVGTVDSYFLVDLGLGYDFQDTVPGLRLNVTAKNVLDNDHREFVGAPLLGRLVLARLTYDIPISR